MRRRGRQACEALDIRGWLTMLRPAKVGVTVTGLIEDLRTERHGVIGAQQAEARQAGKGHIQERLVELAFNELGRASSGPDGLSDASHRLLTVLAHELQPSIPTSSGRK